MNDDVRHQQQQRRNLLQTVALVGGIGLVMAASCWLLWGWPGVIVAVGGIAGMFYLAPRVPPELVMRMYRAAPMDARNGLQILRAVGELARRAELPAPPRIYVVPSSTLNAFAVGRPDHAAIAVTEGLLRKLDLRELLGVLAHEISHIRNDDLKVMGLADMMSRVTQVMSWTGLALFFMHLPSIFTGATRIPWLAIALLYLAPAIGSLLQFALSRTREFDADLDGAVLTGDPGGLAAALAKIERYQGRFWEDLVFPSGRRIPQPSVLRTHPTTEARIERLRAVGRLPMPPRIGTDEQPMVTLVGFGPITMRPRYRIPGIWF